MTLLILQACTTDLVSISESDVLVPTVRVTLPERGARRQRSTRLPSDRLAELSASAAIDNIGPPGRGHFTMFELSAAYSHSSFGTEEASLDFFGGLGFNKLDLEYEEGTTKIDKGISRFGPIIGAEFSYKPDYWLTIYVRGSLLALIPDSSSGQTEAGLQFSLSEEANVLVAWRYWNYSIDDVVSNGGVKDIDIKMHGLVFGFVLNF